MSGEAFNNFKVYLELQRRNEVGTGYFNRIPLFVDSVSISTSKMVANVPVPFSGAVRGESLNLAFDVGQATKSVNMSGMLLGQHIKKKKNTDIDSEREVNLTSFEMAQLIHSYVDASSFQDDQNMSRLVILIPSRIDHDFAYHNGTEDADKDISELELIPFTWKNRGYDNDFASIGTNAKYFTPYNSETSTVALTGFIRSFNTTMSGAEFPSVGFTLDFEEAMVLADNFLD
jgi:hypothetical protein